MYFLFRPFVGPNVVLLKKESHAFIIIFQSIAHPLSLFSENGNKLIFPDLSHGLRVHKLGSKHTNKET